MKSSQVSGAPAGNYLPAGQLPGDASNSKWLKQVLGLGLMGAGTGVGIRAALGLKDILTRSTERRRKALHPAVIEIGVPSDKQAQVPGINLANNNPNSGRATPDWMNWLAGRQHKNVLDKPLYWTSMIGAPAAGLYGGYQLVDSLINKTNAKSREQELEDTKEEYRKALIGQYTNAGVKGASDQSAFNKDLDTLVELIKEGQAQDAGFASRMGGFGLNHYLPIAALLALGSGGATYSWIKSRSSEERLAKAIKQRERLRYASRPPEIYAVTKPYNTKKPNALDTFSPGTEQDEESVAKIAMQNIAALYKP